MAEASFRRAPPASVAFCRSDPARSTRWSVALRFCNAAPGKARLRDSSVTVNTACEREDSRFISVCPTRRLNDPRVNKSYVSSALVTKASVRPSTKTPRLSCSRI